MNVTVKYFASLRERVGKAQESLELPVDTAVAELWARVIPIAANGMHANAEDDPILAAVNHDYVGREHILKDGDEVAFFPPVTGG
jgi:molybdopterin synthase sulfur carrier subunit